MQELSSEIEMRPKPLEDRRYSDFSNTHSDTHGTDAWVDDMTDAEILTWAVRQSDRSEYSVAVCQEAERNTRERDRLVYSHSALIQDQQYYILMLHHI